MAEKMGGTICDECRVLTQYKEYYRINSNDYCSLGCFYENDKNKDKQSIKVKDETPSNKSNKSKNKVHKKKPKQKKGKRK